MKTGKILLGLSRTARNRASGALDDDHERDPAEKQLAGITSSDPPSTRDKQKDRRTSPCSLSFLFDINLGDVPLGTDFNQAPINCSNISHRTGGEEETPDKPIIQ